MSWKEIYKSNVTKTSVGIQQDFERQEGEGEERTGWV